MSAYFLLKRFGKQIQSLAGRRRFRFRPILECLEERLAPAIDFDLVLPAASTYGVTNSLAINYVNTGATFEAAPVVVVSADNADLWLPTNPDVKGSDLQLLATSPTGDAGRLPPGTHGTIIVYFTATTSSAGNINFTLNQLASGKTINWSSLQDDMRPSYIAEDAWDAVFANFTANVGSTTDSYQAALGADATYLGQFDDPTHDVARLVAYEISKADNAYSVPASAQSVDASLPAPGPSLSFSRSFLTTVSGRYRTGTMSRGWVHNWDVTASADNQGNVTIDAGGALRYFAKKSNGGYRPTLGDHGVLTVLTGGGYQLQELGGGVTVFNANGTLNYVRDTNGNRITATYTSGLLSRLTHSNGSYLTLTYSNDLLTGVTDSADRSSSYSYDATGEHLLTHTDDYGTTTYSYVSNQGNGARHALASITYADNTHVYFNYDSRGRLIEGHRDNNQQRVTALYSQAGGFTITNANDARTTVLPDDSGQIREIVNPLGQSFNFTFNASGDMTEVKGPEGINYVYGYDLKGNLISAADPLGLTTTFTHNATGDLTGYTDAKGNTTHYRYDNKSNLLAITYANGSEEKFNYNPLGEVTQFINANGAAIGYAYNTDGQVTRATFADGSIYAYTYDPRGNIRSAFNADGAITFKYQDNTRPDLITEIAYPDGKYLKFTYNVVGRRTQSTDHTGFTVNYTYDQLGRLQKLIDGGGALIVSYSFDGAGYLIRKDLGNGTRTVYTYDKAGRLLSITNLASDHVTVNSFNNYTYNALGNVVSDTNQDGQWLYSYDAAGQLIEAVFTPNSSNPNGLPSQRLQYVYDAAGNRISQTVNGVTTTYTVNNVNEYTRSTTGGVATNYRYDLAANLISKTTGSDTTTYTYNDLGRLIGVNGPGQSAGYTYDPLGNRNSQTVNGAATQFLIDPFGLGDVVGEFTGAGSLIAHYTHGFGLTSRVDAGGVAAYYDFNLTGSTVGITNATGRYVNKYSYLPFGQASAIVAALPNRFTFVGAFGVSEDGSDLFDMRLREYAPATGQFLSNDPIGLTGGDRNLRRYVANSPIRDVDPEGTKVLTSPHGVVIYYDNPNGPWNYVSNSGQRGMIPGFPDSGKPESVTIRVVRWQGSKLVYDPSAGGTVRRPADFDHEKISAKDVREWVTKGISGTLLSPGSNGTTTVTTEPTPEKTVVEGQRPYVVVAVAAFPWSDTNVKDTDFLAYTKWNDEPGEKMTAVVKAGTEGFKDDFGFQWNPENGFIVYSRRTFDKKGVYSATTRVEYQGSQIVDYSRQVNIADERWIVNPVSFSAPVGGTYHGPIATFRDLNPYGDPADYSASWVRSATAVPAHIVGGSGGFTVIGDVDFTDTNAPGTTLLLVRAWDVGPGPNPPGGDDVVASVTLVQPETPLYSTMVQPEIIQVSGARPYYGELARIITTDPIYTSQLTTAASNFISSDSAAPSALFFTAKKFAATSNDPRVVVSHYEFDEKHNGAKQITIYGIVNAAGPGSRSEVVTLDINMSNLPTLTARIGVNSVRIAVVVNPVPVVVSTGQAVRNVQVASLSGPRGDYSATIAWGDGDTSQGQITALGGDLFTITASKPNPYAAAGDYAITVDVNGPGNVPPPVQTTATVRQSSNSTSPAFERIVIAARQRWSSTSLSAAQLAALERTSFLQADLPDGQIAVSTPGVVWIDSRITGLNWFVDQTPLEDSEFSQIISPTQYAAADGSAQALQLDLLTVVMKEMGRVMKINPTRAPELFGEIPAPGIRRLPRGEGLASTLSQLRTEHGFANGKSYYENWLGLGEKWFRDRNSAWHYITPAGDIYRWISAAADQKIAEVDPLVHADPTLLFYAPAQLTDTERATLRETQLDYGFYKDKNYWENWSGLGEKWLRDRNGEWFYITADGVITRSKDKAQVAQVSPLAWQAPELMFAALERLLVEASAIAAQVQTAHGFYKGDSYWQSYLGQNEKWFQDRNNQWHYITSDGWVTRTKDNVQVVQLTPLFWRAPELLFGASEALLAESASAIAQVHSEYGFKKAGSYSANWLGLNEKWILDQGRLWYYITADGKIWRWRRDADVLVAELTPAIHTQPERLFQTRALGMV